MEVDFIESSEQNPFYYLTPSNRKRAQNIKGTDKIPEYPCKTTVPFTIRFEKNPILRE